MTNMHTTPDYGTFAALRLSTRENAPSGVSNRPRLLLRPVLIPNTMFTVQLSHYFCFVLDRSGRRAENVLSSGH